jgi:tetraacyldisaccharide-1-P 4'-kinase
LQQAGFNLPVRPFADHHPYDVADWNDLDAWRQQLGGGLLLTTLKDLVKLPSNHPAAASIWALQTQVQILSGEHLLLDALDSLIPRHQRHVA